MVTAFLARKDEVEDNVLYGARIQGVSLVYFKQNGNLHVFDARCPHKSCNLARMGKIEENYLICTCHDSRFEIGTGTPIDGPARASLKRYQARERGDALEVEL
ncbi:MAG TPA: Rieske (2Fe-2S) protein [Thermoplasmataceae archaeon]|nr:Rieske (2Fe-2S) protein [Thermoplasmatales archaeon AK]HLH86524.1 Rieske (2Fe-2S) protein [Thermoplasmataceae archaeon]